MNYAHAMFPGSFDVLTLGHLDIIERCSRLYEKVFVVVANNVSKQSLFSAEERCLMIEENLKGFDNVEVHIWDGLVVDFAKKHDIGVIVRGVRNMADFGYEFELAETYKILCPEIEVLFMPTDPKYFLIRSSSIKEMAHYGADISKMVPQDVSEAVKRKLNKPKS